MRRRRMVWQLVVHNPPEVVQATGRKRTIHSLGKDTAKAIAEAEKIRRKRDRPFDEIAAEIALDENAESREEAASAYVWHLEGTRHEDRAVRFYRQATRQDVSLKTLAEHNRDLISDKTYSARLEAINRAGLTWLSDCPDRQSAVKIVDDLLAKGLSRSTVSLTARTLNTLWRIAIDRGFLHKSPFEKMGVRVPRTEKRALTPKEFKRAIAVSEDSLTVALLTFLGLTGLRVGAALAIEKEHCERDTVKVVKDKTGSGRVVVLSKSAQGALKEILRNAPIRYDAAHKMISKAYGAAKLANVDVHSLRRTAAQAMLECGVSPVVAAHLLGHSIQKESLAFGLYATHGPSLEQQRAAVRAVEKQLL